MEQRAYSDLYLNDAMKNLGACFDYGINVCKYPPDLFMTLFIKSGLASHFGACDPRYICGMSGTELAIEIFYETTDKRDFESPRPLYHKSPEYWAGWVLSLTQWYLDTSFDRIQRALPLSEVISLYHPLHEADESKFIELARNRITATPAFRRINEYRKKLGLSQRGLAEKAGINLRTLQQYEIGAKDISKASYKIVRALEDSLGLPPGELIG